MKIILAGGTGFVGNYLNTHFTQAGHEVILISRQKDCINWTDAPAIQKAIDGAGLLVNLAGKSVNCRYTDKNKNAIVKSRTETTRILGEAVSKSSNPPELWINSSTATIYRYAEDRPMTETEGEIGSGFSVGVAKQWEEAFLSFKLPHTRQVALRMAIVMGDDGGVMGPMTNLVKFGLGGRQGSGKQKFSWVHIEDLYYMILFLQANKNLTGIFNGCSPNAVDNATLMRELRTAMKVSVGLPSPGWMLKIGAFVIGTEPELVLKSRWAFPDRFLKEGFKFTYPLLAPALANIMNAR